MRRKLHLLFFCFIIGKFVFSQAPQLTENAQVSLLTCAAGDELYYAFGHSAFRVQDPALGIDVVYNYGTFDFNQPNFYLNFTKGRMIYSLSRRSFEAFLYEYELEKRWVKEQILDLNLQQRNQLLAFFEENYLPENRDYLYDPLLNNCSSITGDILKEQFGEAIVFDGSYLEKRYTFRQLVRQFMDVNTWSMFGIDLAFGSPVDRKATVQEHMFLPYYAMEQLRHTTLNGKPLVKRERTILDYSEHTQKSFFPLSPLFWFLMFLAFTAVITYFDYKHKTRSRWLDFSLLFITGLAGTFLFLLWVAADHTSTPYNFNILWAFPTNAIVAFALVFQDKIPQWAPKYLWAALGLMGIVLLLWIIKIQIFSPVLIPLLLTMAIRYLYIIRYSKLQIGPQTIPMNLLTVENISKSYGELVLFSDISFGINKDQKIALIAKNGSGKTSILNIMSGKDTSETGQVTTRKGIKISFLEQEPDLNPNLTIEETIFTTDNEILKVIANYEKAVENPENTEQYQKAFEAMDRLNAWDFETQYKQILFQLQLSKLDAKVSTLSGGQKKRLALANALLNKPDLMILDEPTNHLDLEMIEWLEAYFAKESITLFMVTHDRYFLDRVCNEILELDNNQLYTYKGNYSYYLSEKEARMEREAVEQQKTKMLYKKELDWMRRQPKARTTKSKSRIDDFAEIKQRAHQRRQEHEVQLELNMERMGSKILELHNISKSYGDKTILNKFDYNFTKGERVGIIGKNGTGKSTFLNIITQQEGVEGGKVVVGDTVKFGYYTQKGIHVKEGQKVIDVIREFGDFIPLKKGRQISAQQLLERFLFDRKKQYDFVEKLSGGERKRLYLCTVLIQNPNFLILDEPTNDLDIVTLNVLESFLLDFPGCLIVVSHDRYFMDKIVDHLFVFRGEGVIEDFPGNYSDYRTYESSKILEERENKNTSSEKTENNWRDTSSGKLSYSEQKEYKQLEKDIQKLEEKKVVLQNKFTDPELDGDEIANLSIELKEVTDAIEEKTERWFELSSILEG